MANDPPAPICPICGEECERTYRNLYGEYVGCDVCAETRDAWEDPECFPGKMERSYYHDQKPQ